jgi:hypothetical protein
MLALPDIESLRSLVLSCSSYFEAFKDAESFITRRVLLKELNPEILPEALAVLEASKRRIQRPYWTRRPEDATLFKVSTVAYPDLVGPKPDHPKVFWDRSNAQDFISQHFDARTAIVPDFTFSDALALSKMHSHVSYLAEDFASRSLSLQLFEYAAPPVSESEMLRIHRALYHFEVYCNIFRDFERPIFDLDEQRVIFFAKFSPWENEQLACIHEYLYRVAAPGKLTHRYLNLTSLTIIAFNDIAEHDVVWSVFNVNYADDIEDTAYIEPIISRGLPLLHLTAMVKSYEERYKLLTPGYSKVSISSLRDALIASNDPSDGTWLEDFTQENERAHIRPSFFEDPDSGPEYVWRWAHQEVTSRQFVNTNERRHLREWGYVFWDQYRLDLMGILQSPFDEDNTPEVHETEDAIRRKAERKDSRRRRRTIYNEGGRGWWSFENESKVVWPKGKAP